MPYQLVGTTPNLEQNPKSILADRNHPTRQPEKSNDHNSPRVTFAKVTANKQTIFSSATTVSLNLDPVAKAGTPNLLANAKSSTESASNNRSTPNNPTTVRNEGAPKPTQNTPPQSGGKQAGDNALTMAPVRKSELEKTLKQNPNVRKAFADWLSPGAHRNSKRDGAATSTSLTSSRRSVETIGSTGRESARSTDTSAKRVHSKKSRKRMQKLGKHSSGSVGGGTKRSKSGRRLKRSKKTEKQEPDKDLEAFKPAPLDAEYASELHKISQILTAVSTYSVPTSGTSNLGVSLPTKDSSGTDTIGKRELASHAVHRPLSGDELKQLLSSITRVVSLHQLPVNEQISHSGTSSGSNFPSAKYSAEDSTNRLRTEIQYHSDASEEDKAANDVSTSSSTKKAKKKKRRIKKSSTLTASRNKEAIKSKSRLVNNLSTKSKTSTRKGRPKEKDKSIVRKPRSNNSSVSSLEKDPIKNAAFLKKYYEESTRLANKKSSEDFIPESQLILPEEIPVSSKKKTKKVASKTTAGATISSRSFNKRSIPAGKTSQQLALDASIGLVNSDKKDNSREEMRKSASSDPGKNLHQSHTRTIHMTGVSSKPKRSNAEIRGKGHRMQPNVSTTAVAGSPKPISPPPNHGDGENIFGVGNIDFSKKLTIDSTNAPTISQMTPVKTKTHVLPSVGVPESNAAGKQDQFKNIEDMMNSRLPANAKSIWEKTPYQPMTHARFRDMVSKYASPEATIAIAQAGEDSQMIHGSPKIPVGVNIGPAPGNLLSLPKHWEIKEKLNEELQKDKPIKQLQGPPKNWPDSATTSTYTRLDMDYKYNSKDIRAARTFRKMLREDDIKNRAYIPAREDYLVSNTAGGQNELVDSIKFYRNGMKRNANRNSYY